jgi:hypothetical protein
MKKFKIIFLMKKNQKKVWKIPSKSAFLHTFYIEGMYEIGKCLKFFKSIFEEKFNPRITQIIEK